MNTCWIRSVVLFFLASLLTLVVVLFSTTSVNAPGSGTHSFIKKLHIPRCTKPAVLSLEKRNYKGSLPHCRIAILTPCLDPVVNMVMDGFEDTLDREAMFTTEFRVYDSKGDRILLRSQVEDILSANFDLVHSIGTEPTKMLKEVCEKRNDTTPVVFNLVSNPVGAGLIASKESSGNNLTGVLGASNVTIYVHSLIALLPRLKNVLIVYNPTQMGGKTEQYKKEAQALFESKKISVTGVEVFNAEQIAQRTPHYLKNVDLILTLPDATVNSSTEHLVKLCNLHGIPLAAPYLESLDDGVALCNGMYASKVGVLAAGLTRQILEKGKHPTDIPVVDINREWQTVMKKSSMKKQGLKLDPTIEFLVRHTFVVGKNKK